METRKSDNITATPRRKDNNTSDRPSDRKQGKGKKSKINKNYYAVFGRMARTGEEQDMAEKTKNLGLEKNTLREQTEKTLARKEEESDLDTGKLIKTWEEGKMEDKKDGTRRRPRSKRTGGGSSKEDCMEVEEIQTTAENTRHQLRTGQIKGSQQEKRMRELSRKSSHFQKQVYKQKLHRINPQKKQAPRKPPTQKWQGRESRSRIDGKLLRQQQS